MDDKEYYTMMNKMPSAKLLADLKKAREKKLAEQKAKDAVMGKGSFIHLESHQGREDAEMLLIEKK